MNRKVSGLLSLYRYDRDVLKLMDTKFTAPEPFALVWNKDDDFLFVCGNETVNQKGAQLYEIIDI